MLLIAAVAGAAAAPLGAAEPPRPAAKPTTLTLATRTLPARLAGKRYWLRIEVTRTAGRSSRALKLLFARVAGSATQTQSYSFNLPRAAFSCTSTLGSCRLATGRSLGRFGRIDLSFGATTRRGTVGPGAGCTGTVTRRSGAVSGSISFVDGSGSLRVAWHAQARRHNLRATLDEASIDCAASRTNCEAHLFGLGGRDPGAAFALVVPSSGAAEAQFVWSSVRRAATVDRSIVVRDLAATSFTIAPDLSSASFDARGLQFLSGSVAYTASSPAREFVTRCGQGTATLGGVTGDVAAVFDGVGRRPLSATGGYLESLP
jgi:hypothetical protein